MTVTKAAETFVIHTRPISIKENHSMFGRKKKNLALQSTAFFAIGALAGAAVALLLAPTTGKKLQKQLKAAVDDQVDNIEKAIRKVV